MTLCLQTSFSSKSKSFLTGYSPAAAAAGVSRCFISRFIERFRFYHRDGDTAAASSALLLMVLSVCVQLLPPAGDSGEHLHIAAADHSKQDGSTGQCEQLLSSLSPPSSSP